MSRKSDKIREAMSREGVKVEYMADLAGFDRSHIYRVFCGSNKLTLEMLEAWLAAVPSLPTTILDACEAALPKRRQRQHINLDSDGDGVVTPNDVEETDIQIQELSAKSRRQYRRALADRRVDSRELAEASYNSNKTIELVDRRQRQVEHLAHAPA